jgi:hypothetical protein
VLLLALFWPRATVRNVDNTKATEIAEAAEAHLKINEVELDIIGHDGTETAPHYTVVRRFSAPFAPSGRDYDEPKDLLQRRKFVHSLSPPPPS